MAGVESLPTTEKIRLVVNRVGKYAGEDAQRLLNELLTPEMLEGIAITLGIWGVAQFFGVGEIVDILMLALGVAALGQNFVVFAKELATAITLTLNAQNDPDLDDAAQHLGHAIVEGGVEIVLALLMRKDLANIREKLNAVKNMRPGLVPVRPKPPPGVPPTTTTVRRLPNGAMGVTDEYGNITLAQEVLRDVRTANGTVVRQWVQLTPAEIADTLNHELVHRFFSPKWDVLREFRASVGMTGYVRMSLLRYLEEALAEGYAMTKRNGLVGILMGAWFPVAAGYVSLWDAAMVTGTVGAIFIGVIEVSGRSIKVFVNMGNPPADQPSFNWQPSPAH
jgi:hypothetical protein